MAIPSIEPPSNDQPIASQFSSSISNFANEHPIPHFSGISNSFNHSIFYLSLPINHFINSWIIDSRETNHMISSSSLYTLAPSIINSYFKLPKGHFVHVTHNGTVEPDTT